MLVSKKSELKKQQDIYIYVFFQCLQPNINYLLVYANYLIIY